MIDRICNIIYMKTFHIYDILYKTLIKNNTDEFLIDNNYICPDYIADETTIIENKYCNYKSDNINQNNFNNQIIQYKPCCIDFILFFIGINLFYIGLFLFIEKMSILIYIIFNKVCKIDCILDSNNINFDYIVNKLKKDESISKKSFKENIIKDEEDTSKIINDDINIISIDKDDIEEFFHNYSEIIKIQQYLNKDDNLDKVLYFYKESSNFLQQTQEILNDKYRNIFLDKEKFLNYYKSENNENTIENNTFLKFINITDNKSLYTSCRDKVSVNLNKLYETEQLMIDSSLFNIYNNKKYFPLKKDQLCYLTNLSKLNVIIWLIDIGFYDYLKNHV